jgi:abhydrolase domain-containing protein 6
MLIDLLHRFVRSRYHSLGFRSYVLDSEVGKLHYFFREQATSSKTIVLVHGLGTSSSTWLKILPYLDRRDRIAALDLPGFGFSKVKGEKGFCTLEEHVNALSALVAHIDRGPIVLLGHSLGGWVCALFAAHNPGKIQHLILADTAGVYYRGVERLREIFTLKSVNDARRMLDNLWYRYPWYFKPFAGAIYRDLRNRRINELIGSIETRDFLAEELASLSMQVSIVWGEEDAMISPECVMVLRRFITRSDAYFIRRCGHVPQLERPKEFAKILNQLLEKTA